MGRSVDERIVQAGGFLPQSAVRAALQGALGDLHVALCMHRVVVSARRPGDWQPALTIEARKLDSLIELLLRSRKGGERWLSVTFDDGYLDSAEYIASRAPRYPEVEFIFFVCPAKTARRVGFRWDLVEANGAASDEAARNRLMDGALDVAAENQRKDLADLARRGDFQLASVQECLSLLELPNVALGNHTNCHFRQTDLTPQQAQQEYERSQGDFERLFGPQQHFAFPFGTPGYEFDDSHVALLRALSPSIIWTTQRSPYRAGQRRPGAVLPRFPVVGTWNHRQIASWIAARTLVSRARGELDAAAWPFAEPSGDEREHDRRRAQV